MANRNYTNFELMKRLVFFMKHLMPRIALAILMAWMGFLTMLFIPSLFFLASSQFFGEQNFGINFSFWVLLLLFVVLAFLRGIFRYAEHYFGHYVAFHSLAYLRKHIFQKMRALAPAKLDEQNAGVLLKMVGEDVEALEVFYAHTLAPIGTGILAFLFMFLFTGVVHLSLALIVFLSYVSIALVLPLLFTQKLEKSLQNQNVLKKTYQAYFLESLSSMADLLQFQKTEERFLHLQTKSEKIFQNEREVMHLQSTQMSQTFFVLGLSLLVFALQVFRLLQGGEITLLKGIVLFVAFTSSFPPFLELNRLPLGFKKAMVAAQNFFSLMDEAEAQGGEKEVKQGTLGEIEIKNIAFAYPKREINIYDDVSLKFSASRWIGIRGASGSGKSTLMKLLMRWYDVQKGEILFDIDKEKMPVRNFERRKWQQSFAYVPQIPQLFKQSIRENLVLANETITDEEIWEVAEKCRMKERLQEFSEGLDTIIEGESTFSSGEAQRLELMRALLKKADIYIFDEPTSYLDSLNEAMFLSIVKQHCQGLVFLVSHRASTLAFVDDLYAWVPEEKTFKKCNE